MADRLWVLDASVAVAWLFTDEPSYQEALRVRAELCDRPNRYMVPALFHSELAHLLGRKSGGDERFCHRVHELLLRLGLRTLPLSDQVLRRLAYFVCTRHMSGYDGTYAALAEDLGARWLTCDRRAARRAGRTVACSLNRWQAAPATSAR